MTAARGTYGCLPFADPRGGGRTIPLWHYLPTTLTADTPLVIVMHGMRRNAPQYRDDWAPHAERHGLAVVAPEFAASAYPDVHAYNYGNVVAPDGTPNPREAWLFPVIDAIFAHARDAFGCRAATYCLYGHSAGGQLVHRLATLCWSERIALAITANAGSYTLPRLDEAYPFGLGGTVFEAEDFSALFARPLLILLGGADSDPGHYSLPRQPQAQRQGAHRHERGLRYFAAAEAGARERGLGFAWRVETVPGVAHANAGMAARAAQWCAAAAAASRSA